MPELPEVETIKRGLQRTIIGKEVIGIKILNKKSFIGNKQRLIGKTVLFIKRRAKMIIIGLGDWKNIRDLLVIHLKMTGQLIFRIKNYELRIINSLPNKHTRVIIEFKDKSKLFFNDMRKFGWMRLVSKYQVSSIRLSDKNTDEILGMKLGVEPLSKDFTVVYLQNIFSKTSRQIKQVLLDQTKIVGIGNIYANEALFMAGINPDKKANKIKKDDIKRLRNSVIKVLNKAIKLKGTTSSDYIQPDGKTGNYQNHFLVYQREGENCIKCGKIIKRVKIGGRSSFYCPNCQK